MTCTTKEALDPDLMDLLRTEAESIFDAVMPQMKDEPCAFKRACFRAGWNAAIAAMGAAREHFSGGKDWIAIHRSNLERLKDHKVLRSGLGKLSPYTCKELGMTEAEAKAVEAVWSLCEGDDFYVDAPAMDPPNVANCVVCGRIVDTRETSEGGDQFGAQLSDGHWTCSSKCWDKYKTVAVRAIIEKERQ